MATVRPEEGVRWSAVFALACVVLQAASSRRVNAEPADPEQSAFENARAEYADLDTANIDSSPPLSPAQPPPSREPKKDCRLYLRSRVSGWEPQGQNPWGKSTYNNRILVRQDNIAAGVIAERDRDEPTVLDHRSATIGVSFRSDSTQVVLGSMAAHIGTGLVVGRAGMNWTGSTSFQPRQAAFSPSLTTLESGVLNGIGVRHHSGSWNILALYAIPRWDASLDSATGKVTALRTSGTHVTAGEIRGRHALRETFSLGRLSRSWPSGSSAGISLAQSRFEPAVDVLPRSEPFSTRRFVGADGRISWSRFTWWGEGALSTGQEYALASALRIRESVFDLTIAGWRSSDAFIAPHGVPWSITNGDTGENGTALVLGWKPAPSFHVSLFRARGEVNSLGRTDSLPRAKTVEELEWTWELRRGITQGTRWKRQYTSRPGQSSALETTRHDIANSIQWSSNTLVSRLGTSFSADGGGGRGYLAFLRGTRRWENGFSITGSGGAHRSNTTSLPMYVYEQRTRNYGLTRTLYKSGVFWSLGSTANRGDADFSLFASQQTAGASGHLTLTAQIDYVLR